MSHCCHGHHHHHAPANYNRAFALGVLLNAAYIVIEAVCGFWYGSLALLADAGHNLGDVLGLLIAWGAYYLSSLKPTERRTYGWGSSSILASLLNGVILLAAMGGIAWEAIRRLIFPVETPVPGSTVMIVAGIGIVINAATAMLFMRDRDKDLNIKGAYLHMMADAAVSAGVVLGGLLIVWLQWQWIDPVISLVIAAVIVWGTWGLLRDSTNLALAGVPRDIAPDEVRQFLGELPGIVAVHDLHIWAMSTTENSLTAHLVREGEGVDGDFFRHVSNELRSRFNIHHSTLQVECAQAAELCEQAPAHVI